MSLLMRNFDNPKPTPEFHMDLWKLATKPDRFVAIAAPRGHAKSTAVTHAFTLAAVLFRFRKFVLLVSDTEGQAKLFLDDIKKELLENDELIRLFGVKRFKKDSETDIIVELSGGHEFRIIAKGSEQKVRGLKWRNKRPDLIIGDDLENDEIVLNEERRKKFRQWLFNALIPAGSDDCLVRIVGTILHLDSALERLMPPLNDPNTVVEPLKQYSKVKRNWLSVRFRAHDEKYEHMLWPEKFPKERLEALRSNYVEQGFPEGYAQEYLNYPIDEATAYFRKSDFHPVQNPHEHCEYYAAADLAISQRDSSAYSVITVAGLNSEGFLKVVDVVRFRGDAWEIIGEIFRIQNIYKPAEFIIEQENIARSIGPVLYREMGRQGNPFVNIVPVTPTQDKEKRARSLQARMRAGKVQFDTESDWYNDLQTEMLQFPKGKYVDQVDSLAHIALHLDKMVDVPTKEELEDEEWELEFEMMYEDESGVNATTGY
jgi:predicted phage terminase large subunit-like protein